MARIFLPTLLLAAGICLMPAASAQNNGMYGNAQQGYAPAGQYQPGYGYQQQPYAPQQSYAPNAQYQGTPYQPMPPMGAPAGLPPGYAAVQQQPPSQPGRMMSVAQWFQAYDQIRRQAQMNPTERQRADNLLSRGLSILMPGPEKVAAKSLLSSLTVRYQRAAEQLRQLPVLKQTEQLHHSYFNYFASAGQLFGDYVRVQDNLLVTDAATGQPLASGLIQRKQMLEMLEHQCKAIDAQTRTAYGIAPYPY